MLEYAVGVLVALLAAVYMFFLHRFNYWQRRGVPFVAPRLPCGNVTDVILGRRPMLAVVDDIYKEHRDKRFIGTYFLFTPVLQLQDVDIIRQVYIKEFQDFSGRGTYWNPENDPLSGHLFILGGQAWKSMRAKLVPAFSPGKVKYMFGTVSECAGFLREHVESSLAKGGGAYTEDIRELLARFSTDVISSAAFGIESNSMKNPHSEFRRMGQRAFEPCMDVNMRTLLEFFARDIMKMFSIRSVPNDVHEFFTRIVADLVEHREKNNVERADLLNILIRLKNDGFVPGDDEASAETRGVDRDDQKLTGKEIAAQVFVFFIAGFETTSSTTAFTLYELAKHPDIQDKVLQELDTVLKAHGGKVTYDALQEMTFMEMVVQETLRHYPAVPFITREAMVTRPLPLTDTMVEKGTRLLIPVWSIHKDPELWEDPLRYDPMRFLEEAKRARRPGIYMPFGDGPRICIGMRMGLVQVKTALATVLSLARVTLAPSTPKEVRISARTVVIAPEHDIHLVLTAR
ncbi:cytochrome P450 6a2-like isoform X2 [Thrips palmi]|uniref:Cytochrome P450 6a2-like isoform X2 n=1 Tax=Thrips palmi TaxID=161013 RepID=A0A6P8ZZ79_THRPL|nr:cytochrome P450 6a2-like isoform X2 [Thrips palmi]